MANTIWKLLASVALVTMVLGCGGGGPDRPYTAPVSGTVTYNGKPIKGAVVTFNPSDPAIGKTAIGTTDANGKYSMMTFDPGDGVVPGSYKVTVSKIDASKLAVKDNAPVTEENPDAAYRAMEEAGQDVTGGGGGPAGGSVASKDLLPPRYKDPEASGLIANVAESGDQTFNFPLTD